MLEDKIIREKIKDKVPDRKVRNVFFVCSSNDGRNVYAIVGNNNKIFGCALVDVALNIEVVL